MFWKHIQGRWGTAQPSQTLPQWFLFIYNFLITYLIQNTQNQVSYIYYLTQWAHQLHDVGSIMTSPMLWMKEETHRNLVHWALWSCLKTVEKGFSWHGLILKLRLLPRTLHYFIIIPGDFRLLVKSQMISLRFLPISWTLILLSLSCIPPICHITSKLHFYVRTWC